MKSSLTMTSEFSSRYQTPLEGSRSLVVPGGQVTIPQVGARAVVSRLRAPLYETADDVRGSITIRRATSAEVVAKMDLKSVTLDWAYRGTITFLAPAAERDH